MSNRSDRTAPDSDSRNENYSRSRGHYGHDRRGRAAPDGNIAKLEVKSGSIVIIDQFMLGTAQFLKRIGYFLSGESSPVDEGSFIDGLAPAVSAFGGALLAIEPGHYGVYRDPAAATMAIAPEQTFVSGEDEIDEENFGNRADDDDGYRAESGPGAVVRRMIGDRGEHEPIAQVRIETRCLVFIDADHLRDPALVHGYKELRDKRDDKGARDLLRQYGAAVRYGFNRKGDLLGLYKLESPDSFGLWVPPGQERD